MPSLIISSASRSSPLIFTYHSSLIILFPFSFHSIILAFFIFPLIHFTMVLFVISSKLIFSHFMYHTLVFIILSSFPSYFNSITLIATHLCFSFSFASMFSPFISNSSFDSSFSHIQCCVDRKHSMSIRRTCLCFLCMIPEQWHQMIRK